MESHVNEILEMFRDFVIAHDYKHTPILTVYADIDTTKPDNQKKQPAWSIELKNETKALEMELDPDLMKRRAVQKQWEQAEEIIEQYLRNRKPTGRSIVLFTDKEDYIAADLPVAMPTRVYYGFPQIKHLLFALDQYKTYDVILFSGTEARLVEVYLSRTSSDETVKTKHDQVWRLGRKSIEDGQDRRKPEFLARFVKEIASEINRHYFENQDFERLVLGGNLKLAHAVRNNLHPAVKDVVVAIDNIDFKQSDLEIAQSVRKIAEKYEGDHDLEVVDQLLNLHRADGSAVIGQDNVENALNLGLVKKLVIPYPIEAPQFDALIVDAVVNGAEIEFVYGEAAERLNEAGGIGASLYYTVDLS